MKGENGMSQFLYPAIFYRVGDNKWGYINDFGEFSLEPIYDFAESFQENGLAVVCIEGLCGLIDYSGKYIVKPQYQGISQFSEGRASASIKKETRMIDQKGNIYFRTNGSLSSLIENRAGFGKIDENNEWSYGYIDRMGKIVIPAIYNYVRDFHEGKAIVENKGGSYSILNFYGKVVSTVEYNYLGEMGEGLIVFGEDFGEKNGYINEKGNIVIPAQFDMAQGFQDGRAVVALQKNSNYYYGLIDKNGKYVISPQYSDIRSIAENRIVVGKPIDPENFIIGGSKYAIANINGKILTDFIYYDVTDYHNCYASASDGKQTFFIDMLGEKVETLPSVEGNGVLSFQGNLIKANVDYRITYMDKKGNIIWRQENLVQLDHKYIVQEKKYNPNRYYLVYYPEIKGIKDKKVEKEINEKLRIMSKALNVPKDEMMEYTYYGDYDVSFFRNNYLEIELTGYTYYFGAAHGMPTRIYAHINLENGKFYELKDLFEEEVNYVEILSKIIEKQIDKKGEEMGIWPESYNRIKPNQPFFITEDALYIYFNPYEIASYAAGFPTFKIMFDKIPSIKINPLFI